MHSVFWGGLTPSMLQAVGGFPILARHITSAINRTVMAQLLPEINVRHLLRDLHNEFPPHAALFKCNNSLTENKKFIQDFQRTVDLSNVHVHGPSSYDTKTGELYCRFGKPTPLREETGIKQIEAVKTDPKKPNISFQISPAIQQPTEATTTKRNYSNIPVAVHDNRMIMFYFIRPAIAPIAWDSTPPTKAPTATLALPPELQQQFDTLTTEQQGEANRTLVERNRLVVDYSPVQSAMVGCNTNASLLGRDAQTKAALCYVLTLYLPSGQKKLAAFQ
jgi:hypothetical protein